MSQMSYAEWEDAIISAVEERDQVTRSDAQGIVEAQPFVMSQCWGMGLTPEAAVEQVLLAAEGKPTTLNPGNAKEGD